MELGVTVSELWWMTQNEVAKFSWLEVLHLAPHSDEPGTGLTPMSVACYRSIAIEGGLSRESQRYPIRFLDTWREQCSNTNVFRSMVLYSASEGGEELAGPFVIDIDSNSGSWKAGFAPNINDALQTATRILAGPLSRLRETDCRVFFTGHKGFRIEVRPQALGVANGRDWEEASREALHSYRDLQVGSAIIDKPHDELRLHESVNCWIAQDGRMMYRMTYELSLSKVLSLDADAMSQRGEALAREASD